MTDALHAVVVARKAIEAHNMASFELVPADDDKLPGFLPGAHIDVTLPNGLTRQYSLWNSSAERHRYCIGVWNDANSRGGSKALHLEIQEGDKLQVSRPRNRLKIPRNTARAVLLARGIGVTPMLSIADALKAKAIPFELHYVFALMSPDSFRTTIESSSFAENTSYYKEATEDNQLLKAATVLADRPEDTQLFICGADWWLDPIIAVAKQKGFSDERIHIERFTAKAAAALLDKVFDVKIASTGATYKIPGDKTVTAFLEESGVKIQTSCEQGLCGTCKTKVLDGEIDHRDKRLSAEQRAQGYFLPCVSRAKGDTLVLDL
jgi:vanillate O-demethylase ferredoxin subunit